MPKGKGYSASQLQSMRNEGVFSPSEIENLTRIESLRERDFDNSTRSVSKGKGGLGKALGGAASGTARYKYFPDN